MITLFYLVAFYPRRTVVNSIGGADNRIQLVRGVPRSRRDDARDDCGRPQMNFSGEELVEGLLHFYFTKTVPMNRNSLGAMGVAAWTKKRGLCP